MNSKSSKNKPENTIKSFVNRIWYFKWDICSLVTLDVAYILIYILIQLHLLHIDKLVTCESTLEIRHLIFLFKNVTTWRQMLSVFHLIFKHFEISSNPFLAANTNQNEKKIALPSLLCHGLPENAFQVNQLYNVTWSNVCIPFFCTTLILSAGSTVSKWSTIHWPLHMAKLLFMNFVSHEQLRKVYLQDTKFINESFVMCNNHWILL